MNESEIKKQIDEILDKVFGKKEPQYPSPQTATEASVYVNAKARWRTLRYRARQDLLALFEQYANQARVDEWQQAWDWAVINNRAHIKGDFVLKRIRKLKALNSHSPRKEPNE